MTSLSLSSSSASSSSSSSSSPSSSATSSSKSSLLLSCSPVALSLYRFALFARLYSSTVLSTTPTSTDTTTATATTEKEEDDIITFNGNKPFLSLSHEELMQCMTWLLGSAADSSSSLASSSSSSSSTPLLSRISIASQRSAYHSLLQSCYAQLEHAWQETNAQQHLTYTLSTLLQTAPTANTKKGINKVTTATAVSASSSSSCLTSSSSSTLSSSLNDSSPSSNPLDSSVITDVQQQLEYLRQCLQQHHSSQSQQSQVSESISVWNEQVDNPNEWICAFLFLLSSSSSSSSLSSSSSELIQVVSPVATHEVISSFVWSWLERVIRLFDSSSSSSLSLSSFSSSTSTTTTTTTTAPVTSTLLLPSKCESVHKTIVALKDAIQNRWVFMRWCWCFSPAFLVGDCEYGRKCTVLMRAYFVVLSLLAPFV